MHHRPWFLPVLVMTAACGGSVVFDDTSAGGGGTSNASSSASPPTAAPEPLALYVADREGCPLEAPPSEAGATMTVNDSGLEELLLVELAFIDECTGAGGQHILARTPDGTRAMWLGAHACYFFAPELQDGALHPGVARTRQTAALFETTEGACISFPGEEGSLTSDLVVEAIAVFARMDDASAFAAEHD